MAPPLDSRTTDAELVRAALVGAKEPFAEGGTRRGGGGGRGRRGGGGAQEEEGEGEKGKKIAEIADLARRVRDAVTALPSGQRDAVLLFYLQGLSHREVAAEPGISAGAVKARLHQARAAGGRCPAKRRRESGPGYERSDPDGQPALQ